LDELQDRAGLGLNDGFHDQLSGGTRTATESHSKFTPQGHSFILAKNSALRGALSDFFEAA